MCRHFLITTVMDSLTYQFLLQKGAHFHTVLSMALYIHWHVVCFLTCYDNPNYLSPFHSFPLHPHPHHPSFPSSPLLFLLIVPMATIWGERGKVGFAIRGHICQACFYWISFLSAVNRKDSWTQLHGFCLRTLLIEARAVSWHVCVCVQIWKCVLTWISDVTWMNEH